MDTETATMPTTGPDPGSDLRPPGKRGRRKFTTTTTTTTSEAPSPTAPAAEEKGTQPQRVSFYVTDAGAVDTGKMRADNIAKLRAVLAHPDTKTALGLGEETLQLMTDDDVHALYGMLSALEVFAFTRFARIDPRVAAKVAPYTEQEIAQLKEPTKRILSKYGPDWMFAYRDEINLAVILIMLNRAKLEEAKKQTLALQGIAVQTAAPGAAPGPVAVEPPARPTQPGTSGEVDSAEFVSPSNRG